MLKIVVINDQLTSLEATHFILFLNDFLYDQLLFEIVININ